MIRLAVETECGRTGNNDVVQTEAEQEKDKKQQSVTELEYGRERK